MDAIEKIKALADDQCRYIHGDLDGDWRYCDAPRARNRRGELLRWAWCAAHYDACTARPRKPSVRKPAVNIASEIGRDDKFLLVDMSEAA
jgi:hypothetical protein